MEASDYLRILRKQWILIAITTLVGLLAMFAFTKTEKKVYTATAQTVVSVQGAKGPGDLNSVSSYLDMTAYTYAAVGGSEAVLDPAARQLGLTYSDLEGSVSVTRQQYTSVLEVTATSNDATRAADIANAVAEQQTKVLPTIAAPPKTAAGIVKVEQITKAGVPGSPTSPSLVTNIGIGFGAGLVLGLAIALILDRVRAGRRNHTQADI